MQKVSWLRKSKQLSTLFIMITFLGLQLVVPLSLSGFGTATASAAQPDKVTICHRTNSTTNPYVQETVAVSSVDGNAANDNGQGDHLAEHTGPVWDPTVTYPAPHNGDQWGDIIPPLYDDGTPDGLPSLNWVNQDGSPNALGQAIFYNGCNPVTEVTPTAPTMVDLTCVAAGSYTIPSETGVTYSVDGTVTAAGTYTVSSPGTHTITAAAAGTAYSLTGTTSWTFVFHAPTGCVQPPTQVTPTAPTMIDLTCVAAGSYTIPSETGVYYEVNGAKTAAGTYTVSAPGSYTIAAFADNGYVLSGTTQWTFIFHVPNNCVQPPLPTVPTAPTMIDLTCAAAGSYTIPSETGVTYSVNGVVTPAGTYTVTTPGSYSITAAATSAAYTLIGVTSWTLSFTAAAGCVPPPTVVTPQTVTFVQPTCQAPTGSYTIPSEAGVIYKVNNVLTTAGTYTVAAGVTVNITAEAAAGYTLALGATSSWSQTFAAVTGCVLGATDVCPNILGTQATVPSGFTKNSQGNCVTSAAPSHHEHGQVLGASTTAQLANTGESVWVTVLVGVSVLATVLGLGLANRKNLKP